MRQRIVLDASAALHIVSRSEHTPALVATLKDTTLVVAPKLFCSEVANGLWKYVRFGELTRQAAIEALNEALSLIDSFESDNALAVEALSGAIDMTHPVYDFTYLVLARRYAATLLTMDRKLADMGREFGVDTMYGGA